MTDYKCKLKMAQNTLGDKIFDDDPDMRERQISHMKQLPLIYTAVMSALPVFFLLWQMIIAVHNGESVIPLLFVGLALIICICISILMDKISEYIHTKNFSMDKEQ